MNVRRLLCASGGAAAFIACSLTQSLDYLQAGGGAGDGGPDVASDAASDGPSYPPATVLAPMQKVPSFLVTDASNLYWVDSDRTVWTVPKLGGAPRSLGTFASAPASFAAEPGDSGHVFAIVGASVQRLAKAGGGAPETILTGGPAPIHLAAADQTIFVAQDDAQGGMGIVVRALADGGARTTIASGQDPTGMTFAEPHVLWINDDVNAGGSIRALAKTSDGGGLETYAPQDSQALSGLAVSSMFADTEAVYVADKDFSVFRVLRAASAGRVTTLVDDSLATGVTISHVAVDDAFAYVTDARVGGRILRVPKVGGSVVTIAESLATPTSIAADSRAIYFLVTGVGLSDGAVMKIDKP